MKTEENICDFGIGKHILARTQKAENVSLKSLLEFIKILKICVLKGTQENLKIGH